MAEGDENATKMVEAGAPEVEVRPGVVRVPGWEREEWLRAGFSTRRGGVTEVYGGRTLNLGWTKEDDPERVVENRRRFAAEVFAGELLVPMVGVRQVHSARVRVVDRGREGELRADGPETGVTAEDGRPMLEGDGLMTDVPGVLLAVGVADCVPVLVVDRRRRAVAAFHAGWRGTVARIVEHGVGRMRLRYGSSPEDLIAAVGPAIGACCYEVGKELRDEFGREFGYGPELFSGAGEVDSLRKRYGLRFAAGRAGNTGPGIYLDLWEANRRQLVDAGVKGENVWVAGECTACARTGESLKYFSHRAERGFAGRGLGAVGVVG